MHLGERLIVDERHAKMAQNVLNYQPTISTTDVRWSEMANDNEKDKMRPEKRMHSTKVKDEHALAYQRNSRSPNVAQKSAQELRENRNDRSSMERGARRDEFVSNLDYFMHSGYPYPNFNVHVARRDSPPDLMAVERAKHALARANEGFFPSSAHSMPPELSKFTPEQIEAIYQSQNLRIPLTISPPELTERASILPPGSSRGGPNQRPSPQAERQHGEFGSNLAFMGMDEKLLRIAEATNSLQNAALRKELTAAQNAGLYPGMVPLPPAAASQVHNFQNQQNSLRFNQELMRQVAAGFQLGIDPRLFEQSRAYQQMAAARNEHSPNDGRNQSVAEPGSNETSQQKSLQGPSRPVALGKSALYLHCFRTLVLPFHYSLLTFDLWRILHPRHEI